MSNETQSQRAEHNRHPITLREIARFIQEDLSKCDEHNLHWVAVIDESSVQPVAEALWTQQHADSLLQVVVANGHSEGMLLHVMAQPNRYEPAHLLPLIRVKLLCGHDRAFAAARDLSKLLRSEAFEQLVADRAQPVKHQVHVDEVRGEQIWIETCNNQGWNESSQIVHLEGFLREKALFGEFASHAEKAAEEENGDGIQEVMDYGLGSGHSARD